METPQEEKVEILSVIGEQEKSWAIDRYHLMVGASILSVVAIMGGIVWLASGGGGSASNANPAPTGELQFNQKGEVAGTNTYGNLPYPSVRAGQPLVPNNKAVSKTPTKPSSVTPTPTNSPAATATPMPEPTSTPVPNPTATSAPTPTAAPSLSISPSTAP